MGHLVQLLCVLFCVIVSGCLRLYSLLFCVFCLCSQLLSFCISFCCLAALPLFTLYISLWLFCLCCRLFFVVLCFCLCCHLSIVVLLCLLLAVQLFLVVLHLSLVIFFCLFTAALSLYSCLSVSDVFSPTEKHLVLLVRGGSWVERAGGRTETSLTVTDPMHILALYEGGGRVKSV